MTTNEEANSDHHVTYCRNRDQSRYAPSKRETPLHCNHVSHWLGEYLDLSH